MSNTLRILLLSLVLLLMAGTAATLQLKAHRKHLRNLQRISAADSVPNLRGLLTDAETEQRRAFITLLAVSFVAVVIVAALPKQRLEATTSLEKTHHEMKEIDSLAKTTVFQAEALSKERLARRQSDESLQAEQARLERAKEDKIRLGRDLHDGIIQSLYAAGLTLEAARQNPSADPAETDRQIGKSIEIINTSIREIRAFIHNLDSPPAETISLRDRISRLLDELRGNHAVHFDVQITEDADALLGDTRAREVLQIVREAASNALRHGGASMITVRLLENGTSFALLVQDDGLGLDPATIRKESGLGLANLRGRAVALRGEFELTSQPGQGARVLVTFPIAAT